jgi:hypothetical protein
VQILEEAGEHTFPHARHGADVNRLAVVAAVIFAELLHAENFTQSRQGAKKFLTRISRINTDVLTANHAKYANGIPNHFRVFSVFRGLEFCSFFKSP